MEKEQKQLIIIILLFSIAALLWLKTIFKLKKPAPPAPSGIEMPMETELSLGHTDFFKLEKDLKDNRPKQEWVRDPFQFPSKQQIKKGGVVGLSLTGIIYDEKSPMAVINDIIVREGDKIDGATVIKIQSDSVILEKESKSYTLELLK